MSKYDSKEVEIKGRKFSIRKFDARTGSFMLIKVAGLLAPMFGKSFGVSFGKVVENAEDITMSDIDISGALSVLSTLSEKDFDYIQSKCLKVCYELLAQPTPVLNDNGSFGVIGLENDTMSVMSLTVHALIFNVSGFFAESPLASMVGATLTSILPTAKM